MQSHVRLIALSLLSTLFAFEAAAEEKNGLRVEVSKRTLNRADRTSSAYYTQYDRTQGYKVTIKNTSLKPMPEGEVSWTIVRLRALSSISEKYAGVEKVKALKPAESVELMFGAVPIGGYRYDRDYKDDMEHEIVVTQGGKELLRNSSKPSFAALAKRATLMESPEPEAGAATDPAVAAPRRATPAAPGATAVPGAPATPGAITTPRAPAVPGTTAVPATPATVPPTQPAVPAATPAATPPASQPATAPADSQEQFDFFNLKKKPPTPAK